MVMVSAGSGVDLVACWTNPQELLLNEHVLFINGKFTGAESPYKRGVAWSE